MANANAIPTTTSTATLALTPLPSSPSSFSPGALAAGLLLALLAGAAFVMARRRRHAPRLIEIVESASLGPKRSLVVARLGDELLLLGSSEGGIALLSSQPAAGLVRPPDTEDAQRTSRAGARPPPQGARPPPQGTSLSRGRVLDLLSRLRPQRTPPAPGFEALLAESLEDVELRRKLAAGRSGRTAPPPAPRDTRGAP